MRRSVLSGILAVSLCCLGTLSLLGFIEAIDPTTSYADSVTTPTSIHNEAIWLEVSSDFQTPSFEIELMVDLEGQSLLGSLEISVDSTSIYSVRALTSFSGSGTTAPEEAEFVDGGSQAAACQTAIDDSEFNSGANGVLLEDQAATTGTFGRQHLVSLQIDWSQYEELALGLYVCDVQVLVSDAANISLAVRGRVEYEVIETGDSQN